MGRRLGHGAQFFLGHWQRHAIVSDSSHTFYPFTHPCFSKVNPMESLYLLIPLSVLLVLGIIGIFWWALYSGQFDNIEREGERILRND
jgi:cbb3-type cytochrome oxidase maturation protein